jgi:FkbM family methyltransferase
MVATPRRILERLVRDKSFRRRLPAEFGRRPIWVSPDARLRFLRPGRSAFDGDLLDFVRRFASPGSVVLDVGANVGEFALATAHRAGPTGHVLAVEADPFLAALMQRTLSHRDNRDLNLEVMCSTVSGKVGAVRFNLAERGRAANALDDVGSTQMGGVRRSILAPTLRIDDLTGIWRMPHLVKIDVEGAEFEVLEGASTLLRTQRPIVLFEASRAQERLKELFVRNGYELFDPAEPRLTRPLKECAFNTLAIHRSLVERYRNTGVAAS